MFWTEGAGSVKMMATTAIRALLIKMGVRWVKALDRRKGMTTLVTLREETRTKMTRTVKTVEGVSTKMILSVT